MMSLQKIILTITFSLTLITSAHAFDYVTKIDCNDEYSEIISQCAGKSAFLCDSQIWKIGKKRIPLGDHEFDAMRWACLPDQSGYKIILSLGNLGNCPSCERYEIRSLDGELLTPWQNFNDVYKTTGFSQTIGKNFLGQFKRINRSGSFTRDGQKYNLVIYKQSEFKEPLNFFNNLFKEYSALGTLKDCDTIIDLPIGTAHGNHSYGGICTLENNNYETKMMICGDIMLGRSYIQFTPKLKSLSEKKPNLLPEFLTNFVIKNCYGG